ncbi:aminotransferase class V-fold PLP-dependent enzyme [Spiractinospora alimapuensis]|uniref:pyridoxal-phosphate-dependent aminotransferase family protein n=1 Tax=Spiractinospora alimapuensis TaxID=2820884 RepID=UPI001F1743F2|nr:aminotransferase class V-fold PLP-dependent enzyme [Spiractinospora alimapuensis]QVQ50001.1 aminotransferase class V-fold PLP-dependent enzyme [Spiractinospora alimapuensis]
MSGGSHFLQIPGPTNVPDRVLRAISYPTIDHRGAEFADLGRAALDGLRSVVRTEGDVVLYPASGTGAWEAALVNTLSPGDRVLMFETGHFGTLWAGVAHDLGLEVTLVPGDWRSGPDPEELERRLREDTEHLIKAVAIVHNETSTGVTSRLPHLRAAMDRAHHPALLLVDTISSLGSVDYRHDEWGVDVTVGCSQKGLMLPPGLSFNAISPKAREAAHRASLNRSYWDWAPMLEAGTKGFFPYTPATNLLYGLKEAVAMLHEEGLDSVYARHRRHAEATRRAVGTWGFETQCRVPEEHSPVLTAVVMPDGQDADALRAAILSHFDISLGAGLSRLSGRVFRIGHLGSLNDAALLGTLAGVEAGLRVAGISHRSGGVTAALEYLADTATPS